MAGAAQRVAGGARRPAPAAPDSRRGRHRQDAARRRAGRLVPVSTASPRSTTRCYAGEGRLAYAPIAAWLKSDALQPTLTSLDAVWLTRRREASSGTAALRARTCRHQSRSSKAGSGCASSTRSRTPSEPAAPLRARRRRPAVGRRRHARMASLLPALGFRHALPRRRHRARRGRAGQSAAWRRSRQLERDELLTLDHAWPARPDGDGAAGRRSRRAPARRGARWRAPFAKPKATRCSSSSAAAWSWRGGAVSR